MFIALTMHQSKQINLLWLLDISMQITPAHSASMWHLCKTKKNSDPFIGWTRKEKIGFLCVSTYFLFVEFILFCFIFFLCFLILYLSQTKIRLGLEWAQLGIHYLSYCCPHAFFGRGHSRGCAVLAEWLGRLSGSTCILSPAVALVAAVSMHLLGRLLR